MDETLRQVGELLLGSIPTIIFMVLLYAIYTALVHKPLVKVLAERRSKTEGAVEKARADIAAAEARTAEYEQRLREARMAVFKNQEALRQQALQAREPPPWPRRASKAHAQVEQARAAIENDKACGASWSAGRKREAGRRDHPHCFAARDQRRLRQGVADETSASSEKSAGRRENAEVPADFCRCHIVAVELVGLRRACRRAGTILRSEARPATEQGLSRAFAEPTIGERKS